MNSYLVIVIMRVGSIRRIVVAKSYADALAKVEILEPGGSEASRVVKVEITLLS